METAEQSSSDVVREVALVLFCFPVELVGADGLELEEEGEEDAEVEVVAHVDPNDSEEAEVGADEGVVNVV